MSSGSFLHSSVREKVDNFVASLRGAVLTCEDMTYIYDALVPTMNFAERASWQEMLRESFNQPEPTEL